MARRRAGPSGADAAGPPVDPASGQTDVADDTGATGPSAAGQASGQLFVVATPIGNLGDVTMRALETLRAVPLAAAEDTRRTARLFARYGVETPLVSYHARSGPGRQRELLAHLRAGRDLALVTDAGTPLVSDPGGELVSAWAAEGGRVVPLPGPSAVLAALVASGVPAPRWSFEGFLPRSGRDRRERLARLAADERTNILFEAPGRVAATLADLAAACGESRQAAVCRELTKLHESVERGSLGALAVRARAGEIPARGEFVIVVAGRPAGEASAAGGPQAEADPAAQLAAARAEVVRLVAAGMRRSDAARRVAASSSIPRRLLYSVTD